MPDECVVGMDRRPKPVTRDRHQSMPPSASDSTLSICCPLSRKGGRLRHFGAESSVAQDQLGILGILRSNLPRALYPESALKDSWISTALYLYVEAI